MLKRVILTTGGTGGHIFPALSVAEELKSRYPAIEILYLGGLYGPEGELARKAGLEFVGLPVRGFLGRGLKAIPAAFAMLCAMRRAKKIMRQFRPDVVIGFGGYAAAAGLAAAIRCKIPTMIHEQNSVPGLSNRILGRFVNRVCLSLPDASSFFAERKSILTGNPVRKSIRELGGPDAYTKACTIPSASQLDDERLTNLHILVLGGSQGAVPVNKAVMQDIPALLELGASLWIQCGQLDYERVSTQLSHYPPEQVRVDAFISDMNAAYEWADIAICRAGATTLAELAVAGLPAIFIPLPHATHNHQFHNAEQVRTVGAAFLIEQKDIVPGSLSGLVEKILQDKNKLRDMSCAALLMALPGAAGSVVEEAERVAQTSRTKA